MLDLDQCKKRQQRLLDVLANTGLEAAVVALPQHVYYFTAHLTHWTHHSALVLRADGRSWLLTANQPAKAAAVDDLAAYEANWLGTQRQEQPAVVADLVHERLGSLKRVGFDASMPASQLLLRGGRAYQPIDPHLWQMRRQKDPDELALMRVAIHACQAMYARARQIIAPGTSELQVFAELHSAAVHATGEPMTALLGNDYAAGVGGGPPRKDHVAQDGQIYILDLGPTNRGYFADNCRAFAVNGRPTDAQAKACDIIKGALAIVQKLARPGVRCRDIYDAVDAHYREHLGRGLFHHLGHGVGLQPHEFPHLNPKWDDVLLENEVFTAEPGIYGPDLAGGIRLENQYLVTAGGVETLVDYPLDLA